MKFSQFIKASDEYTTSEKSIPAPYIRKAFTIDFVPSEAEVCICSTGFYELYINGVNVTKGYLAPYISNPDELLCYDRYDISNHLKKGENAIGIILGNGFANQTVHDWKFSKDSYRAPLKVALKLTAKGEKKSFTLHTDESFKAHPSPIVYDMYRYGTYYDARLEIKNWNTPDFDDSEWENMLLCPHPKAHITECTAEPIKARRELSPVSIERKTNFHYLYTAYKNGSPCPETYVEEGYLYDFGISTAGICRLKITGYKGQKITLRHCEALNENGDFSFNSIYTFKDDYNNYINLYQTDVYILKGGEEEIFIPPFTYHGFRYVLVEGITKKQATTSLITYLALSSDIKRRGFFECSDKDLNTLYNMAINADISNFQYFPTDCPHREKNGWTGDIAVSAEQLILSFKATNSYRMWLESVKHTQKENGLLPGIVPSGKWGFEFDYGPIWHSVCVYLPYYIYKYEENTDILSESSDTIYKCLSYLASKRDEDGLLRCGLGDWCQPGGNENISSPKELTSSAVFYDMLKKSTFIFDILKDRDRKSFALKLSEEIKAAIRSNLIDTKTCIAKGNCQTSQALLIAFDIFTEDEKPKAYKKLLEFIKEKDFAIACGLAGIRHIFHVLCDFGGCDIAYRMITNETAPSYTGMIRRGATALCEAFDENGYNESQNHHFFGDIINLFMCDFAGLKINPHMNNINEIEISPVFPEKLTFCRAGFISEKGMIKVCWERTNGKIKITADIPEGITGSIKTSFGITPLQSGYSSVII